MPVNGPISKIQNPQEHPQNLRLVLEKIAAKWPIQVSSHTLKRGLKSLSMSWLRVQRRVSRTQLSML
jgi:hypothetical protein